MKPWELASVPTEDRYKFTINQLYFWTKHEIELTETLRNIEERIKTLEVQKNDLTLFVMQLKGHKQEIMMLEAKRVD